MSDIEESIYDERKRSHEEEDTVLSQPDYQIEETNRVVKRPVLNSSQGQNRQYSDNQGYSRNEDSQRHPRSYSDNQQDRRYNDNNNTNISNSQVTLRCLVTPRDAGTIIGKQGANIAQLREESGARVRISESIKGVLERVLTASGVVDDVVKFFKLMAKNLPLEVEKPQGDTSEDVSVIRVLIAHSRMGGIIGKGGSKIKDMQDKSGAKLHASEEILPHSTERTLTVTGTPAQIENAMREVCQVVLDRPERNQNTLLFNPINARHAPLGNPVGPPTHFRHGYGNDDFSITNLPPPTHQSYPSYPPYSMNQNFPVGGSLPSYPPPHQATAILVPTQAQQIYIPNEMVGCIIGKGGSKINEMRALSGSDIKVAEASVNSNERLITITGTPQCNRIALHLLYTRLEAEKSKILASAGHYN